MQYPALGVTCEGYVRVRRDHVVFTSTTDKFTLPRKKLNIDQRPTVDANGHRFMVLDGERFERR